MKTDVPTWFLAMLFGVFFGMILKDIFPSNTAHASGPDTSISYSAYRIANVLERIAVTLEKPR